MFKEESKASSIGHTRTSSIKSHSFNRIWLTIETGLLAAVIIIFNLLTLDLGPFGFITSASEPNSFVPLIAPGFEQLVPWFNLWWGLALVVNLINIYRQRWHPLTRLADFGSGIVGFCVLVATLVLRPALVLDPIWAAGQLSAGVSLEIIEYTLLPLINISLFIVIVVAAVSLFGATTRKGIYLLRAWRPDQSEIRTSIHIGIGLAIAFALSGPLTLLFGEFVYLGLGVPLGLALGVIINRQFSESRA